MRTIIATCIATFVLFVLLSDTFGPDEPRVDALFTEPADAEAPRLVPGVEQPAAISSSIAGETTSNGTRLEVVLEDDRGRPVGGAIVGVRGDGGESIIADLTTSFPDGRVGLDLPSGRYSVEVDGNSLAFSLIPPPPVPLRVSDRVALDVPAGAENESARLDEGVLTLVARSVLFTIRGTVVDPGKRPARVFVAALGSGDRRLVAGTWTERSTGTFAFDVDPGYYDVEIDPSSVPAGFVRAPAVRVAVTDYGASEDNVAGPDNVKNDGVLRLELVKATAAIRGIVVDVTGAPLTGGCAVRIEEGRRLLTSVRGDLESGTFRASVPAGVYRIIVDRTSLLGGFFQARDVMARVGEGETIDVKLTLAALGE